MIEQNSLTTSKDEALAIDTVNAIMTYVQGLRARITNENVNTILPLIQDFESWYQALEESTKGGIGPLRHTVDQKDVNEAKRRRDAVNTALGTKLPDDIVPADSPQTTPPKTGDGDLLTDGLKVVGVIGIGYLVLKFLL